MKTIIRFQLILCVCLYLFDFSIGFLRNLWLYEITELIMLGYIISLIEFIRRLIRAQPISIKINFKYFTFFLTAIIAFILFISIQIEIIENGFLTYGKLFLSTQDLREVAKQSRILLKENVSDPDIWPINNLFAERDHNRWILLSHRCKIPKLGNDTYITVEEKYVKIGWSKRQFGDWGIIIYDQGTVYNNQNKKYKKAEDIRLYFHKELGIIMRIIKNNIQPNRVRSHFDSLNID